MLRDLFWLARRHANRRQGWELPAWIRRGGRDPKKCCEASLAGADGAVD
jgi:hypothetical protein